MVLNGTSEPAYHVTISALQPEIAPTKNKRSTHLLQGFMQDILRIHPDRGVVRFEGLSEGNLATNGMTLLQEIQEAEQLQNNDDGGILRTISRQRSRKGKKTTVPIFTERGRTCTPSARDTDTTGTTFEYRSHDQYNSRTKRLKHRKSILAFFKK